MNKRKLVNDRLFYFDIISLGDDNTAGGGRNITYDVYASESVLGKYIRLSWLPKITNGFFLRAESFYNFATHLDEVDDTGFEILKKD